MRGTLTERSYELMVIVAPEIGEEDVTAVLDRVAADILVSGGVLERRHTETPWGRRRLSYPIRHDGRDVREGFYALHYFIMHPDNLKDFERDMRLNERVMRHLTLHIDAVPELPPPPEEPVVEGAVTAVVDGADAADVRDGEVEPLVTAEEAVIDEVEIEELAADTSVEVSEPEVTAKPVRKPRAAKAAVVEEVIVVEPEDGVSEIDSIEIEELVKRW